MLPDICCWSSSRGGVACSRDENQGPARMARNQLCPPEWRRTPSRPRVDEPVGAAFEIAIDRERPGIGKGQILHHDDTSDVLRRIDPEIGVVDAAPAQTAGEHL